VVLMQEYLTVALDQELPSSKNLTAPLAGVDNEIIAYRAIRPAAVISLIFGLLAILCFLNLYFLGFSVLAIACGVWAERKILKDQEIWTGRKFAQTGITLGIVFGLAAFTISTVQGYLRNRELKSFATQFAQVLGKGSIEEIAWFTGNPAGREGKTPAEVYKELSGQSEQMSMPNDQLKMIRDFLEGLSGPPKRTLEFDRLLLEGVQGVTTFGAALYRIHAPEGGDASNDQFVGVDFKGYLEKGKRQWWVESIRYPFEPPKTGTP